jgi:hypothetical protein
VAQQETRNVFEVWWEIYKERDHLEKHRHRQENNIKMDLKEIGRKSTDSTHLVHYRTQWQAVESKLSNYLRLKSDYPSWIWSQTTWQAHAL